MNAKRIQLDRRRALRGALGVVVGLPLLDAMTDGRGRVLFGEARAATKPPVRLLTFYCANGTWTDVFFPKTPGPLTAATTSPLLTPLGPGDGAADMFPYTTVVGGLSSDHYNKTGHNMACFSNGIVSPVADAKPTGPSIEQVVAAELGGQTRIRSLQLSAANVNAPISYGAGGTPMPPIRDCKTAFDTLFLAAGPPSPALQAARARKQSLIDFVLADAQDLEGRLGAADRKRLDEHLTGVREIERALKSSNGQCTMERPTAWPVPGADGSLWPWRPLERANLMFKMYVHAFKCDITRYASFILTSGEESFPTLNSDMGDHELSHLDTRGPFERRTVVKIGFLASLMRQLAAEREGDGTLLDNTLIFYGSEIANGRLHEKFNLPLIIAGRGGGVLKGGTYIRVPDKTPVTNLYCSLINFAGLPVPKYGAGCTGMLGGLS